MKFSLSAVIAAAVLMCAAAAQPAFAGTMQVEKLDRGLIAIRVGSGYYLSWRLLASEPYTTGFNVYRGAAKLNSSPITGATVYSDASAAQNSAYTVRAVVNGAEQEASPQAIIINTTDGPNSNNTSGESAGYIHIDLQRPPTGAQGGTYSPGDGSVADLDGDGVYEIIVKWDPSNAKDNSQSGVTDDVIIDAYKLSGTRMWSINLGPNIRAGAHYTQFMVYDFDGCGKAEMMVKTAPGTKDAAGAYIKMGPAASASHTTAYRNADGYVLSGPEYITVFDGQTGKELATADYWPARGTVSSWGDNYGNRVDRFNAVVAYVDGERPTAVFQRGYYTRMTMAAWDWRNGTLTRRWTFDSGTSGNSAYAGQGNHQMSVADANNDGRHDIFTGAAVIRHDGTGMHTSGFGHGDALHVAHMIKGTATPQIFQPQESGSVGVSLRQASNGSVIFRVDNSADIGRGAAAELDPAVPGFKFWASSSMGLYDLSGNVVSSTLPNNGNNTGVCNFVIWWDGDLARELLDQNQITKWRISNNQGTRLLTASGASSVNGTKSTPVIQADIFGDWREEVVWAHGTSALRIYTTTAATTHRLVTLMHDPVYRVAVAWQNSSYNQPPHPGYYIASDMNFPPPTLDVAVVGGSVTPPPPNPCEANPGSAACCAANPAHTSCPVIPPPPNWAYIGSGEYIDSLKLFDLANAASWSLQTGLAAQAAAYGDRTYPVVSVPQELQGAEWVRASMETRRLTAPDTMALFKMKKDGTVYIAFEDRVTAKPAWLAAGGFTAADVTMSVNDNQADRPFTVYRKQLQTGETVRLGINSSDGTSNALMYIVAVKAQPASPVSLGKTKTLSNALRVTRAGSGVKISYTVKDRGSVRMDLFDIKGNRVKTLVNTSKDAGQYQEHIPADGLAAGMYTVRMSVGKQVLRERIMITR
ncbi:MAG: dockerin [Chitinispirillia bacterium]|nr:dockerin [Chitinispirillia bacterium]MCL2241248.1 dockerin [Chitinispirillia bacterium]